MVGEQFVVERDLDNRPLRHHAGLFRVRSPSKDFAGRQLGSRKGVYVHGNYRVGDRSLKHLQVVRPAVRQAPTDQHETGKRLYYAPVLPARIIVVLFIYIYIYTVIDSNGLRNRGTTLTMCRRRLEVGELVIK